METDKINRNGKKQIEKDRTGLAEEYFPIIY